MAAHPELEVALSTCHNRQNVQLLELPASLVQSLKSLDHEAFQLKSAPASDKHRGHDSASAILCTSNQTFEMRQVQSSNSLYLLQSHNGKLLKHSEPTETVSLVAECRACLELVPIVPNSVEYLELHIPKFDDPDALTSNVQKFKQSKSDYQDEAPFSIGHFSEAWKELRAFELQNQAWIPSHGFLRKMWKSFLTETTLQSIEIDQPFCIEEVAQPVQDDGFPLPALEALLRSLSVQDSLEAERVQLSCDSCILWLGTLLAKLTTQRPVATAALLDEWRNLVPEQWRPLVRPALLQDEAMLATGALSIDATDPAQSKTAATTQTQMPINRWHEKFKARNH